MAEHALCPTCGSGRNPAPTVDMVIYCPVRGIVLVQRKNPPHGWALPGGFIDYGETAEQAALREAMEETGLHAQLVGLLGVYSNPLRDPRKHTMSVVYIGRVGLQQTPEGADDALDARFFPLHALPAPLAFDHAQIVQDFCVWLASNATSRLMVSPVV